MSVLTGLAEATNMARDNFHSSGTIVALLAILVAAVVCLRHRGQMVIERWCYITAAVAGATLLFTVWHPSHTANVIFFWAMAGGALSAFWAFWFKINHLSPTRPEQQDVLSMQPRRPKAPSIPYIIAFYGMVCSAFTVEAGNYWLFLDGSLGRSQASDALGLPLLLLALFAALCLIHRRAVTGKAPRARKRVTAEQ